MRARFLLRITELVGVTVRVGVTVFVGVTAIVGAEGLTAPFARADTRIGVLGGLGTSYEYPIASSGERTISPTSSNLTGGVQLACGLRGRLQLFATARYWRSAGTVGASLVTSTLGPWALEMELSYLASTSFRNRDQAVIASRFRGLRATAMMLGISYNLR
jgi:hypothetical protein